MTQLVKLGDVAELIRGITFKPNDVVPNDTDGSVHCMRTKNVQDSLDLSDVWSVDARFVKQRSQYLSAGDILVSSANSWNLVGKCTWVPELSWPATFGGFVSVLRARPSKVHARYLYRWFSSPRTQATLRSFGRQTTSISNLDLKRVLGMELLLPNFAEQQRIAEVLDQASVLLAKRRQSIALLDNLTQSIFVDMFGDPRSNPHAWPVKDLGLLGQVQGGLQVTTKRNSLPLEVPYLRVANVYRNRLNLQEIKTIKVTEHELERTRLRKDDLLVVEGHGNPEEIGRVAQWDGSIADCVHQNHLIRVRLDDAILPDYACALLNSQGGRAHLLRSANTTSGLNTISSSDVRAIPIILPPFKLQAEFVANIERLRNSQANQEEALRKLNELFGSLQARAFCGEL